ncbi:LytR/AlgR family response regulator transcription factor [Baileyella intestinalis]|uniref:LytR/AlgR family response regulator transcription factor n=1 Tax=Baileyella intestinalis TaxID=2606709 RepID=UPI003A887330
MSEKLNDNIRIGIVDDERPAREGLRYEIENILTNPEIFVADSGISAIQMLTDNKLDLLFLDINLGDTKSTNLVPTFHKLDPEMAICFVTAYSDYAVQAFQLEVDDYIMKPFDPERIERIVKKVIAAKSAAGTYSPNGSTGSAEEETNIKRIGIKGKDRTVYIDIDKIVYIETYERGCNIYTVDNKYYDSDSIGSLEQKLPELFRIHKSYLVNPAKVSEVFPWSKNNYCLKMEGYSSEILPIGRDKIGALRELLERK